MSILQKNKKLAAGIGVAAVAAAALALGAGTYAAFTDTEAGPGGTLAAGTLNLDVTTSPTASATLFTTSNMKPGDIFGPRSFTVTNSGSINGQLGGSFEVTGPAAIQDQILLSGDCDGEGIGAFQDIKLSQLNGAASIFGSYALDANESLTCDFTFTFANLTPAENNLAQGQTATVVSTFNLTQR